MSESHDTPTDSDDSSAEYEEDAHSSDVTDEHDADAQPPNQPNSERPPAQNAIEHAREEIEAKLNRLFAAYQDAFTDYDDLEPREAFAKHMTEDLGVKFPEQETGFGANTHGNRVHGIVTGGRGGGITTVTNFAMDYMAGLVDGDLDRLNGWEVTALAELDIQLRMADTENVGSDLRREAPNDAHRFVQALLEFFDNTDDGGSGNDARQGLENLLEKPEFLAWTFEALALDAASVVETAAVLGGGTGTAITILVDEFARIGLVGQGGVNVGFNLGMQQGRVDNDVSLGQFDDGTPRYTFHDAGATAERVGQRLADGDAQWALWTENIPLTYNYWAFQHNPSFPQMRDFYGPVRHQASPGSVEFAVNNEPRFHGIGHTERDRMMALGEFAFRQLLRRPARVKFWKGEQDYDPADFVTDYTGLAWTPGFDAIHNYEELENRGIPGLDGVNGHRQALRGLSYTAGVQLNSTVSLGEIQRANVVVHAAGVDVTADDLQIVEDDVMNVLELGYDQGGEDKPVRAVLMDGLGAEHYPGGYPLSVTVYAGHDLGLATHERMATPEYKRTVNGGDA